MIEPPKKAEDKARAMHRAGLRRLFAYKLTHYPLQALRLLRRFVRYMPVRDVLYLLVKPFLGDKRGPTKNEVLSRAVEHGAMKDAAANLTRVSDAVLEQVLRESQAERLRIQREGGGSQAAA